MFSYNLDFSFISLYWGIIFKGILVTLELSVLAIVFTTIFGTILGIIMSRQNKVLRYISILFVDIIRSIPILILILFVYYLFPVIGFKNVSAFWPVLVALILNHSSFFADIVRGSLQGLPKGLMLSAQSLGFSKKDALKRIVLPEVYRETFPSITLLYISIIKMTSLASVVAVYEITHVGEWMISYTYKPLEDFTLIAGIYLIIVLPLTLLSRRFEKSAYFKRRTI